MYPWERKRYPRHRATASRRDERASCTLMAASSPSWQGWGPWGPLWRTRGYRLGAGSASCGCLIWGSATSDPVMSSRSQLAQARVGHWVASHTHTYSQTSQIQIRQSLVKGFFSYSFPVFGSFCASSTRLRPCLITVVSSFPLTRGLTVVAHSTRYYVGSCHRFAHGLHNSGLDRPCFHFCPLLSFVVHMGGSMGIILHEVVPCSSRLRGCLCAPHHTLNSTHLGQ